MRIGFIGTGTIAAAMVTGIVADGHQIVVSERNHEKATQLSNAYENVSIASNQGVIDQTDVIILGLMANTARDVLPTLNFKAHQEVFTVMVGIDLEEMPALVAPATICSILIPYPFIAKGNSPALVYPAHATLDAIFGARNDLIALPSEDALKSYLAAQAILSPIIKQLHIANTWLIGKTGDEKSSEQFLRSLIGNYLTSVPVGEPGALTDMLVDLGTEGGLNAQLRDHYEAHGAYAMLEDGFEMLLKQL